jgi:hypothetical protein
MTAKVPEAVLTRQQVEGYIRDKFGEPATVTNRTLAKLACVGGGPEMVKYGRKVGYLPSAIDRWVESRKRVCKSTSDRTEPTSPQRRATQAYEVPEPAA